MVSLKDKVALITGASSGIGAATAHALARAGAKLILAARRIDRLEALAKELKDKYQSACFILELDVKNSEKVAEALYQIPKAFQPIDILINSAGLASGFDLTKDSDIEDWDVMIDTNFKGLIYVTRAILPQMLERNSGYIINISSTAGRHAYSKGSVYCATKAAVTTFSRALKQECIGTDVRITDIAPGMVETEFSEVRFKGDKDQAKKVYETFTPLSSDDIAEAIMFALTRPLHVNVVDMVITAKDQARHLV